MQRPTDEQLVAYLDGELDDAGFRQVETWLERDASLRDRLAALTETTLLIREAYDQVLREPVPERLLTAARGPVSAAILSFKPRLVAQGARALGFSRQWIGMAAAASIALIVVGAAGGYIAAGGDRPGQVASSWLDNIAGYHTMFTANATVYDVPAGAEKHLPTEIRVPDLKPWALEFQGARKLVVEGKPAYQFYYTTENADLGPITITVTDTTRPDSNPTYDRRDGVNLVFWRHAGHGYAIIGSADKGYIWGLANDIAYQLKAI